MIATGSINLQAQNLNELDNYEVDKFYKKIDLARETLDEGGRPISFVLEPTTISSGNYQIELTEGPGDLYKVRGSNLYLKLRGHYGYVSYRDECILKVGRGNIKPILYKLD